MDRLPFVIQLMGIWVVSIGGTIMNNATMNTVYKSACASFHFSSADT